VADFGHGSIGQLRLFAELGAEAVGIDVDPGQIRDRRTFSPPT